MYSLVYTNSCKQKISISEGYKDEKIKQKPKNSIIHHGWVADISFSLHLNQERRI